MVLTRSGSPAAIVPASNDPREGALILVLVIGLLLLPIWFTTQPVMVDYPNHLSRIHVLANIEGNTNLARYYERFWQFQPNLAIDVLGLAAVRFFPIEVVGKLLVSIALLLPAVGAYVLQRHLFRTGGPWPLLSFLFSYNRIFLWGFLNFLISTGVALLALAGWDASRNWVPAKRVPVRALLGTVVMFGHLFAFAAFCVMAGAMELFRAKARHGWSGKAILGTGIGVLPLAIPALIYLLISSTAKTPLAPAWTPLPDRVEAFVHFPFTYAYAFDAVIAGAVAALLVVLFVRRHLHVHPAVALTVLVLAVVQLFVPDYMMNVGGVNQRIPSIIPFLLLAGTGAAMTGAWRKTLTALIVVAIAARSLVIFDAWEQFSEPTRSLFADLNKVVTPGDTVVTMAVESGRARDFPASGWEHQGLWAVTLRDAFVPTILAGPKDPGQPLRVQAKYVGMQKAAAFKLLSADSANSLVAGLPGSSTAGTQFQRKIGCAEFLLVLNRGDLRGATAQYLSVVASGPRHVIYRVNRAAAPPCDVPAVTAKSG